MKKIIKSKWFKYSLIEFIVGIILLIIMLFYQNSFNKINWINGMQVSGLSLFAFGWIFYINNEGLFDIVIYGTKYFMKSLIGRRMEKSYYETRIDKKPISPIIFITLWIQGVVWIVLSFIIYLI